MLGRLWVPLSDKILRSFGRGFQTSRGDSAALRTRVGKDGQEEEPVLSSRFSRPDPAALRLLRPSGWRVDALVGVHGHGSFMECQRRRRVHGAPSPAEPDDWASDNLTDRAARCGQPWARCGPTTAALLPRAEGAEADLCQGTLVRTRFHPPDTSTAQHFQHIFKHVLHGQSTTISHSVLSKHCLWFVI